MKKYYLILLLLLFCPAIIPTLAVDDVSVGSFHMNEVSDPPLFTEWLGSPGDPFLLYYPNTDVEIYCVINDPDNSSDELTVIFYYSNDSFASQNISQALTYDDTPSPDHYRYNYVFPGEQGTSYKCYYYVTDNGTDVYKPTTAPAGPYYTLQWGILAPDVLTLNDLYHPANPINNLAVSFRENFAELALAFVAVVGGIMIIKKLTGERKR